MLSVTVKELIELLEKEDGDAPIVIFSHLSNCVLWLDNTDQPIVKAKDGVVRIMGS